MSCNKEFFVNAQSYIQETWAQDIIEGRYPNISYYQYTASTDGKYHISEREHMIQVPCDDSLSGTAEKTIKCLKFLREIGKDFDYVFRTNVSTYVNVFLLDKLVQSLYDSSKIWAGIIYLDNQHCGPYDWCPYARGSALLLSRDLVNVLCDKELIEKSFQMEQSSSCDKFNDLYSLDDTLIGLVLNTHFLSQKKNILYCYMTFGIVTCQFPISQEDDMSIYLAFTVRTYKEDSRFIEKEVMRQLRYNIQARHSFDTAQMIEYIQDDYMANSLGLIRKEELIEQLKKISKIPYLGE